MEFNVSYPDIESLSLHMTPPGGIHGIPSKNIFICRDIIMDIAIIYGEYRV